MEQAQFPYSLCIEENCPSLPNTSETEVTHLTDMDQDNAFRVFSQKQRTATSTFTCAAIIKDHEQTPLSRLSRVPSHNRSAGPSGSTWDTGGGMLYSCGGMLPSLGPPSGAASPALGALLARFAFPAASAPRFLLAAILPHAMPRWSPARPAPRVTFPALALPAPPGL